MFVVLGNTEAAIKSFAAIDPFLTERIPSEIQTASETPGIVPLMTERVARSGVLALSRIWDDSGAAISLKKLMKSFAKIHHSQASVLAIETLQVFNRLEAGDPISRLRSFRKKFLAHSSGEEQDFRNDVTANEMKTLLLNTTDIVSNVWELDTGAELDYRYRYESFAEDAYFDWCKLLSVTPKIEPEDPEEVFIIVGDE